VQQSFRAINVPFRKDHAAIIQKRSNTQDFGRLPIKNELSPSWEQKKWNYCGIMNKNFVELLTSTDKKMTEHIRNY